MEAGSKKLADFVIENLQGDAVVFGDDEPREAGGEEGGVFEFGDFPLILEAHGGRAIEEDVAFHVRFLLEGLEVVAVGAGVNPPIDQGRINRRVSIGGIRGTRWRHRVPSSDGRPERYPSTRAFTPNS